MIGNMENRADDIEYQLDRLAELTRRVAADTSIMTRDIQVDMIDILIWTRPSKEIQTVAKIRNEALLVLSWVINHID